MKRLYTLPEARGHRIGEALVKRILDRADEIGYDELYLDTLKTMKVPRKLYEKHGFVETTPYYFNPFDAVYMYRTAVRNEKEKQDE